MSIVACRIQLIKSRTYNAHAEQDVLFILYIACKHENCIVYTVFLYITCFNVSDMSVNVVYNEVKWIQSPNHIKCFICNIILLLLPYISKMV